MLKYNFLLFILVFTSFQNFAQHSIARVWNEVLLQSIRDDFARPTVHARNLFHISAAMYDAFAIYDDNISTYYLGKILNQSYCPVEKIKQTNDVTKARETTISYAAFQILKHRFKNSPNAITSLVNFTHTMDSLGLNSAYESIDYKNEGAAALGNYIAKCYIEYGLQDGSNEQHLYQNNYYLTQNEPLNPEESGNTTLTNPNNWQPLKLDVIIDQSGNLINENITKALSPEWGNVLPFSLTSSDLETYQKNGNNYNVYLDPGEPPLLEGIGNAFYKSGFEMVSIWSCHLTPTNNETWNISPGAIGNITEFPDNIENYNSYYNYYNGGDFGQGHDINPITNLPYEPNLVRRGNFTRVLAEFWADGPDSETPPGHWFTILNYVNDHPLQINKFNGIGDTLSNLEWDVKSYFLMGSAMHDAAISTWSIKGYYDYIRPISAIRYLAGLGQCSNENLPNYNPKGINLHEGYIELVGENDELIGENNENLNKIKLYCWRGPDYIENVDFNIAGVGWILAENWWPYQRPSFVTPPFSGYISGHSTFSAAAAEILTLLTGNEFFPGGLGEFFIPQNNFLVFERGPTQSFNLQWATYKDAANQSALSRIWGGIHPAADDIPGRKNGKIIAEKVFTKVEKYFNGEIQNDNLNNEAVLIFPNPTKSFLNISLPTNNLSKQYEVQIFAIDGSIIFSKTYDVVTNIISVNISEYKNGLYLVKIVNNDKINTIKISKN